MNKNVIWILAILIVPVALYWGLTKNELTPLPAVATTGDEIIKFSSPMCYECQQLREVMDKVFPEHKDKIMLTEIDVTKGDNTTKTLVKEYNVKLVPTTVFKNQDGRILRRVEGNMKPEVLDGYMVELINE